jgi:hypothetical protein
MAVRYFCDRCNEEVPEGELSVVKLMFPPNPPLALEVCSRCARGIHDHFTASEAHDTTATRPTAAEREPRKIERQAMALLAPAITSARRLAYLVVASGFFFLVTWLTAR